MEIRVQTALYLELCPRVVALMATMFSSKVPIEKYKASYISLFRSISHPVIFVFLVMRNVMV